MPLDRLDMHPTCPPFKPQATRVVACCRVTERTETATRDREYNAECTAVQQGQRQAVAKYNKHNERKKGDIETRVSGGSNENIRQQTTRAMEQCLSPRCCAPRTRKNMNTVNTTSGTRPRSSRSSPVLLQPAPFGDDAVIGLESCLVDEEVDKVGGSHPPPGRMTDWWRRG